MKKIIFLILFTFINVSCERELITTTDFRFDLSLNLLSGNTEFVSNNIKIKLINSNLGESPNTFKIKYISDSAGTLKFEGSSSIIPMNEYIDVPSGDVIFDYTSLIVGQQNVTFYSMDETGNVKDISTSLIFTAPSFDFNQDFNISATSGNNAIHEVFIENEDVVNDTYELKYELLELNWVQDPANNQNAPVFIVGDTSAGSINLSLNTFNDITSTLTVVGNRKKINVVVGFAGYSQFKIRLTLKNSLNVEKVIVFDHNGSLPPFNIVDFLSKYKRGFAINSNGANNYIVYTFCFNIPVVSGSTLTNFKVMRALSTSNSYSEIYSSSVIPNFNGSQGRFSDGISTFDSPFDLYHKYRILLTYSNGSVYWVDEGTNYNLDNQITFGAGITNFINAACN